MSDEDQTEENEAKTEEEVPKVKKPKKKSKGYTNNTRNNVFTSVGRCRPGQTVEVPAAEAKDLGLE